MLNINKYGRAVTGILLRLSNTLTRNLFIRTTATPNPLCMKFLPGKQIMGAQGSKEYRNVSDAKDSLLAKRLFRIEGIHKLFYGSDFISVTKNEEIEWEVLKPEIIETLTEFFIAKDNPPIISVQKVDANKKDSETKGEHEDAVETIRDLMKIRVAPMLNADGGGILFRGFDPASGVRLYGFMWVESLCYLERCMRRLSIKFGNAKRRS